MRLRRFAYYYRLADIIAAVAVVVASLAVVRYGASVAWYALQGPDIAAYRVVGSLMPVYRESSNTHGLSLDTGRMRY